MGLESGTLYMMPGFRRRKLASLSQGLESHREETESPNGRAEVPEANSERGRQAAHIHLNLRTTFLKKKNETEELPSFLLSHFPV